MWAEMLLNIFNWHFMQLFRPIQKNYSGNNDVPYLKGQNGPFWAPTRSVFAVFYKVGRFLPLSFSSCDMMYTQKQCRLAVGSVLRWDVYQIERAIVAGCICTCICICICILYLKLSGSGQQCFSVLGWDVMFIKQSVLSRQPGPILIPGGLRFLMDNLCLP